MENSIFAERRRMKLKLSHILLLLFTLSSTSWGVVNPEGVDWDASSTATFVQSAYVAIYGTPASEAIIASQVPSIKNRADRYKFAGRTV
jgi:hypothetical protein